MITDRNGEPLAVSTPVASLWANPQELSKYPDRLPELARATDLPLDYMTRYVSQRVDKEFMYIPRHHRISPGAARKILALEIQIGRAHVCTPVTNAHNVCRLLLE